MRPSGARIRGPKNKSLTHWDFLGSGEKAAGLEKVWPLLSCGDGVKREQKSPKLNNKTVIFTISRFHSTEKILCAQVGLLGNAIILKDRGGCGRRHHVLPCVRSHVRDAETCTSNRQYPF